MVDASVGGKTAVNLKSGKNLCGVFHQPRLVLCDTESLKTLERPVFAEGMAEVIKHGALSGGGLLDRIRAGETAETLIADYESVPGESLDSFVVRLAPELRKQTADRNAEVCGALGPGSAHALVSSYVNR
jgi:3-dehydroquinate synthetase